MRERERESRERLTIILDRSIKRSAKTEEGMKEARMTHVHIAYSYIHTHTQYTRTNKQYKNINVIIKL